MGFTTKSILLLTLLSTMFSCSKHNGLSPEKVRFVRPVFRDTSFYHHDGYKVKQGLVLYDKHNSHVKDFLAANMNNVNSFEQDPTPNRVLSLFQGKKKHKYYPIKVVPLSEFGYIQTVDGKMIFYGVMGKDGFIDLTNKYGYH